MRKKSAFYSFKDNYKIIIHYKISTIALIILFYSDENLLPDSKMLIWPKWVDPFMKAISILASLHSIALEFM